MITNEQKAAIGERLQQEFTALGSWKTVAKRVGIRSDVTVRYNMIEPEKWSNVSDKMWVNVATALGLNLTQADWQLVPTANTERMARYLANAQRQALFLAISHRAGQGKSAGAKLYRAADTEGSVYYIECEESWSHKTFLMKLAQLVGIDPDGQNAASLTDAIVAFFKRRSADVQPLLILDEASKLKDPSLRLIIPLYNKLRGDMGLVIVGADDLERRIKRGVRLEKKGYDELASRLGRKFLGLIGVDKADVAAICAANGLTDEAVIDAIWQQMLPTRVAVQGTYEIHAGEDLRRLERLVVNHTRKRAKDATIPL